MQINEIQKKIAYAQALLASNPGANDTLIMQEFLADFRNAVVELVIIYGQLKADVLRHEIKVIQSTEYVKIKEKFKSVEQIKSYILGTYPMYAELETLKILVEKYFPQVSPECITLIRALKRQDKN